jgi:hypothetical protein
MLFWVYSFGFWQAESSCICLLFTLSLYNTLTIDEDGF